MNGGSVGGTDKPNNGCTACHGVLAGATAAAVLNTSRTSAPGYNGTGVDAAGLSAATGVQVGAHDAHVRDEGAANLVAPLDCTNCHGTKPLDGNRDHANGAVAVGWGTIATGNGIVASPTPLVGTGSFTTTWEGGTRNCTNYCHSNAKPLGQASATYGTAVSWTTPATLGCTDCHQTSVFGGTGLSPKHERHVSTYGYGCVRCHVNTAASNTAIVTGGGQHVDGSRDVAFDGSLPNNNVGGTYDGVAYKCSNTYCHSGGADRNGADGYTSGPSIAWNTASTCTSCHGFGTTMVNTAHGAHTNQAAVYGTTFGCQTCHAGTTDGTSVTTLSKHVNQAADVDAGLSYVTGGCTTYCHSSGKKTAAETTPYAYVTNMVWNSTVYNGCDQCHGAFTGVTNASKFGEPNYDNLGTGSYRANAHFQHVGGATACYACHKDTVTAAGNVIANPALHMNGQVDIAFDSAAFTLTYVARSGATAPSCNSVSCHDNPLAPSQWGGTISEPQCSECHIQSTNGANPNGDQDTFVYQAAPRAMIDIEDYNTYGHGRTSAFNVSGMSFNAGFPGMTVGGAMTNEGCFYCHLPKRPLNEAVPTEALPHGYPSNPFRLANAAVSGKTWGKNGNCLICHGSDATGFDPDAGLTNYGSKIASVNARVSATHYAGDHGAGHNGGELCWDCHDPHGDFNYGSGQLIAYMIHEKPIRAHDTAADPNGWGIPDATEFTTNTVIFNSNVGGAAGVFDGPDYTDTAAPDNGVCQVCHTTTSKQLANGTGRTHMTGVVCTKCHLHNSATATGAFKELTGCNDCHYQSPTIGGEHTFHLGGVTPAAYGATMAASTATTYKFNCGKCHPLLATSHYNHDAGGTAATPYVVEVAFDWTSGATPYAAGAAQSDTHAPTGLVFKSSPGTCNTYCHSNAIPVGKTAVYAPVTWTDQPTLACTACHGGAGATTNMSTAHARHVNAAPAYAYACSEVPRRGGGRHRRGDEQVAAREREQAGRRLRHPEPGRRLHDLDEHLQQRLLPLLGRADAGLQGAEVDRRRDGRRLHRLPRRERVLRREHHDGRARRAREQGGLPGHQLPVRPVPRERGGRRRRPGGHGPGEPPEWDAQRPEQHRGRDVRHRRQDLRDLILPLGRHRDAGLRDPRRRLGRRPDHQRRLQRLPRPRGRGVRGGLR